MGAAPTQETLDTQLDAMLAPSNPVKTAPTENPSERDLANIRHAIFQAEQGLSERGVPIGAALVRSDGVVIGVGRNRRVQQTSAISRPLSTRTARCTRPFRPVPCALAQWCSLA